MPPRIISALTVVQWLVVFLGVVVTGAFLKLYASHWPGAPYPRFPQIMRDYGFWLVLLPLVWALAATLSIRSVDVSPSTESFYLLAGSILLAALCIVFVASAFVAFHAATYSGVTSFQ